MATGKLVGAGDLTVNGGLSYSYAFLARFTCEATGTISEFRVKSYGSGNVKVAIYADDGTGDRPTTRLSHNDSSQAVVAGWNTLSIPGLAVTKGTYYWLAITTNTDSTGGYNLSTGVYKRKSTGGYDAWTWPNPATYDDSQTNTIVLVAGWGILVLSPSSITQPITIGLPTVSLGSTGQTIAPSSIVQPIDIGTPSLLYPQTLLPSSIIQAIVYGTPSVGTYGIIVPQSIVQQISIGSPTLLKYVWHVILDGQYLSESPNTNRVYIIGRDQYGNPVWGEAHDTAESGLVGERLDFQQELSIPTTAQAGDVASAVLSKMRLRGKGGVILIPPNCGQELFDVVQISDSGANQSAVTFRVVGIHFEYNPKQARYQHKLILGAL